MPARAQTEPRPQWELGAGALAVSLPDYRGSDESRGYLYPFPYVVYRGERLRVDRQGLRGVLFESERFELDFSLHGTTPVRSSKNRARAGMPDLDPTLEAGPMLIVALARRRADETRMDLRLPLRAVVATDLAHARGAGFVFHPHLNFAARPAFLGGGWNLGLQAGALYATGEHHRYFYGVAPEFATPERPAYEARGGYSGAVALASLSRRFAGAWLGGFLRYDALEGTAFRDSPLLKRERSVMAGLALAWIFAESHRKVAVDD